MRNLTTLFVLFFAAGVFGQTTTKNYVQTTTAKKATTATLTSNNNNNEVIKTIQYYDGLGRPMQTVTRWGTPNGKDLITPIAYDERGREAKQYLPYGASGTSGAYLSGWSTDIDTFYHASGDNVANSDFYYSETKYEKSPLSRITTQAAPGNDINATIPKVVTTEYRTNTSSDVIKWTYDGAKIVANEKYDAGLLFVKKVTDEDQRVIEEFTDHKGRLLMKRSKVDSTWANTYYIYDDLDRLQVVIPPVGSEYDVASSDTTLATGNFSGQLTYSFDATVTGGAGTTLTTYTHILPQEEFLTAWAFVYEYDGRGRMISKQVPGGGKVLMVYDKWDRLVLTQDSSQRVNDEWLFTKYDAFNRPVLTGKKVIAGSEQTIRADVHTSNDRFETYSSGPLKGYTNDTYPSAGVGVADLLTVTYYDDHNATTKTYSDQTDFTTGTDLVDPVESTDIRGLVTVTLTEDGTGTSTFIETATFYDDRQRVIQTLSDNHLGGTDRVSNQYDFVGNVRKTRTEHSDGTNTYTVLRTHDYDHMNRLTKTTHKTDTETAVTLSEVEYNERGEPIERDLHDGEQSIDYSYNIRGWLTKINDAGLNSTGDTNTDLFGMELFYDASSGLSGQEAQYNGNISSIKWSNYDSDGSGVSTRGYVYDYDDLNRITDADHFTNGNNDSDDFNMSVSEYDLNGNIKSLDRYGDGGSHIDDLTYAYDGNQLIKVDDAAVDTVGFTESGSGTDYTYDGNGNMISDANKGITAIDYNHLNLPTKVTFDASNYIEYQYDAAGIKLQQKVTEGGSVVKTTDYVGEFIYEDGVLQLIQHEEGRVVPEWNSGQTAINDWDYQYYLKDHLGNTRLTFAIEPEFYESEATMEVAAEANTFNGYVATSASGEANSGSHVYRNFNNSNDGLGMSIFLSINKGDTIKASAYAYYDDPGSSYSLATGLIEGALFGIFNPANLIEEATVAQSNFDGAFAGGTLLGNRSTTSTVPHAFVNYIFFDRGMNYENAGFKQITSASNGSSVKVTADDFIADQDGYIIVYLSNETTGSTLPVSWDDFTVYHGKTNVVQTDDYYPFGLAFNSSSRTASVAQNFRYNGFEHMNDLNLGLYDYQARYYDPAIGRFTTIDPAADLMRRVSPYAYAFNNPIRFTDPDGMIPNDLALEGQKSTNIFSATGSPFGQQANENFNFDRAGSTGRTESSSQSNSTSTREEELDFITRLNRKIAAIEGIGQGGSATVYVEEDGLGHVYIEIDGTVYSYGRYLGSDSPALGALGPVGPGVLIRLNGATAQEFISTRTQDFPTQSFIVEGDTKAMRAHFDNLFNNGTPIEGRPSSRVVDRYSLIGNNCTTGVCAGLRSGGVNIPIIQTPAGFINHMENYFNKLTIPITVPRIR